MAKWVFTRAGTWDYPTLGFTATTDDIIEADLAPDAWWDETDSGATPTIPVVPSGGVEEPASSSLLVYNAVTNRGEWTPLTDLGLDEASLSSTYVAIPAGIADGEVPTWDEGTSTWIPGTGGAEVTAGEGITVTDGRVSVTGLETDLTSTFLQVATNAANAASYTFTAQAIGTADTTRTIVVAVGSSTYAATISSVTVQDTITATLGATHKVNSTTVAFYYAQVPTGTTANVLVTFSTTVYSCAIAMWSITGEAVAVADSATSTTGGAAASVDSTSGAVVLAASAVHRTFGAACAWTGVTEDADGAIEVSTPQYWSVASRSSAATETVDALATWTGGTFVSEGPTLAVTITPAISWLNNVAVTGQHRDLAGIQGGTTGEAYHLTGAQSSDLTGDYNFMEGLRAWRAALARVGSEQANVAVIGDSIAYGLNATGTFHAANWPSWVRGALQTAYGDCGDGNYALPYSTLTDAKTPWWTFGGAGTWSISTGYGFSGRQIIATATAATATLTFTGTAVDILYSTRADGGTATVTIDGGAVASIVCSGAASYANVASYTGLTDAEHTLVITADATAGKATVIEDAIVHNPISSGDRGVRVINCACPGAVAGYYNNVATKIATIAEADLVVIALGTNDRVIDPATFLTNMGATITAIQAAGDASILLLNQFTGSGSPANADTIREHTYTIAKTYGCAMLDIHTPRWGGFTEMDAAGMFADTTHPSAAGQRYMGRMVLEAVAPWLGC